MAENEHDSAIGDKNNRRPFTLSQTKFFDGSPVVVHTSSRAVLFGRIVKHKQRTDGMRLLIQLDMQPTNGYKKRGKEKPKDPDQLLLDSAE